MKLLQYDRQALFVVLAMIVSVVPQLHAQETNGTLEMLAGREGNRWRVPVAANGRTRIPRVCASLRAAYFDGKPDRPVIVHPEIEYWELRFEGKPLSSHVILEFDSYPATLAETEPTEQAGDGTLTLLCSHGRTVGEKLRFEPQPHKNTIGYWVVAQDSVSWPIAITRPSAFNVGLLQGAGDKGGGIAEVALLAENNVVDSFEFQVEVTGHFQNFRWKHAGTLAAMKPGRYTLRVKPKQIDNVALMDIRQIHLSPKR